MRGRDVKGGSVFVTMPIRDGEISSFEPLNLFFVLPSSQGKEGEKLLHPVGVHRCVLHRTRFVVSHCQLVI